MIPHCLNQLKCKYSKPFDLQINQEGSTYHKELSYTGEAIEIIGVSAESLKTAARFTDIKNSRVKKIDVIGSVYLHDCASEIEEIHASEDIFLYKCFKVNHIVAERDIFVIHPPPESLLICNYGPIEAKRDINHTYLVSKPSHCFTIGNCSISRDLKLDKHHKIVEVLGDCSRIPKILFDNAIYLPSECKVSVKKGATFKGEVVGGELVYEG